MSEQIMAQPERDAAAYALAAAINNLVVAASREIEELRGLKEWRGLHAREDMLREEILRLCVESNTQQGRLIDYLRRELAEILALMPSGLPTVPLVELSAETWDQLRYPESLRHYVARQRDWSAKTFGPGERTLGIAAHIAKELDEIRAKPRDLTQWIDVIILALDGYWRHGGDPDEIMEHLNAKQRKNFARQWPAPGPQDRPTEHVRAIPVTVEEIEQYPGINFPVAEPDERAGLDSIGE